MRARVPIFTYHALDASSDVCAMTPATFRAGIARLADRRWRTADLAATVRGLASGTPPPSRTACLTFDDGYRSVYTEAFPALRERGMTATVFLTVGPAGTAGDRLPSMQRREMLSWSEIREMAAAGIAFGSHARTHPDLTRLGSEEIEAEMTGSKAVIEERLGVAVAGFAYPYGRFDARCHALARRHFAFACADTLGVASTASDVWALPRVETYYLRGAWGPVVLASPWLSTYLLVRRGPRALRRAIEGAARSGAPDVRAGP